MEADAQVLIKKGKRFAAVFLQEECKRNENSAVLNELLEILLDPNKSIDSWDTIDWCRWLMAGGKTPDEFAQTVRRYDNATTCGLVWTANFVAYRCRTCGISPCMSLCAECFLRGNHEGHDFNMFRSQAGGACDCGDTSVMKETGFCQKHGPQAQLSKPQPPPDLVCVAEMMMPRIILRLIQHLRENSCNVRDFTTIQEADGFLTMLHQLSELGGAMRKVMTDTLRNPLIYASLAVDCSAPTKEKEAYLHRIYSLYEVAKSRLTNIPENYLDIESLRPELKHKTFLEELVFWTVKFEFPQKLVCFLLNMLTDADYKVAFTQTFVQHYSRISVMLAQSTTSDTLSNRVVHVSVQLFSNEDLTFRMTKEYQLLHIMVISIQSMMNRILVKNTLQDLDRNFHYVVDCSHSIMKDHCYWPLVSDLNNVLTHKPVALEFLKDASLLKMWFSFLLMFQGMNVNLRELRQHVEFESNTYYAAFLAELEASATPMWALISHLKDLETVHLTKQVISLCLSSLEDWFEATAFSSLDYVPNPYQVSFHLPLHRHLALFICQALTQQNVDLEELLPSRETLQMIMMHPLQAQVAFHEIMSGLWVRNGVQIKGQAMTYIQCHFCNSMVDPDLFLLQLCASQLEPNWFIKTVFQRFRVWDWLSFDPCKNFTYLEPDHLIPMLEASLTFLATLVDIHTSLGLTEEDITRQEMVSLLCMSDRTHSQLMDLLPEKCGTTSQSKDFENILSKIADYKAPNFEAGGNMLQGIYVPKSEIWEQEYDPIHVMLRAVHRRDFQASVDRYTQFVRQTGKFNSAGLPWLPYRVPRSPFKSIDPCRILQCETFHAVMFTILYRAFQDPSVPEHIYSLCIYLLELAVRFSPQTVTQKEPVRSMADNVPDLNYQEWYPSNWTLQNILLPIRRVTIPPRSEMSAGLVEEMEIDEDCTESSIMDTTDNSGYQVQSPLVEDGAEDNSHPSLPNISVPLALPSSSADSITSQTSGELVLANTTMVAAQPNVDDSSSSSSSSSSETQHTGSYNMVPTPPLATYIHVNDQQQLPSSTSENMAIVPTPVGPATLRPRTLKFRRIPGRHNVMLTDSGIYLQVSCKEPPKALPYVLASVEVNESILSILLRLHSKFSGKPDSYKPKSERSCVSSSNPEEPPEVRIGDGAFYIGHLLDRIVLMNVVSGEAMVQEVRQRLWPRQDAEVKEQSGSDGHGKTMDKEERRRRARERQQKLMAEFASRQKAFMEQTMTTENQDQRGESGSKEVQTIIREYECIICGQTTPSTLSKPIGMVILVQATSVLGHMHQDEAEKRMLPYSDDDKSQPSRKDGHLGRYMKKKVEQMARCFDTSSWQVAVNIGWEGGVHIQSCGHYVHMDCHKSYTESLRSQQSQRHQNLAVERGEYFCPLCRQLANSVLPVNPDMGETLALVKCHPNNLGEVAQELVQLFSTSPVPVSPILKKMADIMEDLTVATYPQYRSFCSPDSHSVYLFVCSIARTNLEVELLLRRLSSSPSQKKNCFVPLFHVLACHAKVLPRAPLLQWWSQLTGLPVEDHLTSLTPLEQEVPAFLRDVSAALIQVILVLPLNIDKVYYHCVVQILYDLSYVQALAQLSCQLNLQQRLRFKDRVHGCEAQLSSLSGILGTIIDHLEHSALYLDDDDLDLPLKAKEWTEEELEGDVQTLILPFLRVAALLQSHLYGEELPNASKSESEEFQVLARYVGLPGRENSSMSHLAWVTPEPLTLINTWCQDMINFVNQSLIAARTLFCRPLQWHPPALLKLPESYNEIFQYYHRRPCLVCHSIPKDPSMCLVCGTMVCLRENCCRQQSLSEAVTHSISCGAGTAIFLAVNSSTIVVIRGKRACLWGSVYLDKFGEEDRDLKRGKPLYLSQDRYRLLQQQWLSHSFDHTSKRWVWHRDNL